MKPIIDQARDALFLDTAKDDDLSTLGGIYGVQRPRYSQSDDLFRQLIPLLGAIKRTSPTTIRKIVDAFYGKNSGVSIYTPEPNHIVVVIPMSISPTGTLPNATYLQIAPIPLYTSLTTWAAPGDTVLNVIDTSVFTVGTVFIDTGTYRESVYVDTIISGTQLGLSVSTPVSWNHVPNAQVEQVVVEPSTASYIGDYFGVDTRKGALSSNASVGDAVISLSSGHNLPPKGFYWLDYGTANAEEVEGYIQGDTLYLYDYSWHSPKPHSVSLASNHSSGAEVIWFDLEGTALVDSSTLTGGNPVILFADARDYDILDTLNLLTASGVVVTIERIGR